MGVHNHTATGPGERATVGFLIDYTDSQYQFGILQGISDYAAQHHVNLICFEGGILAPSGESNYQKNFLYTLAGNVYLDGLIILSDSIGHLLSNEALLSFRRSYGELPVVFVGRGHREVPSIVIDSFTGMKEMMLHLIDFHQYRAFGFIKGHPGSFQARERFRAFEETMAEYKIAVDADLISDGDFTGESGEQAVCHMLDTHKKTPEVIVACNDEMAIGAMGELERRGIRVPADVAVVGVDDIPKCAITHPPLSSVRQPLQREGWTVMEYMMDILDSKTLPAELPLDTRIIVRESCGCSVVWGASNVIPPKTVGEISMAPGAAYESVPPPPVAKLPLKLQIAQITLVLHTISYDDGWKKRHELAPALVNQFVEAVKSQNNDVFLSLWDHFLRADFHLDVDEVLMHGILYGVRSCTDTNDVFADNLYWLATSMLEKRTLHHLRRAYHRTLHEESILNNLRDDLAITQTKSEIIEFLYEKLRAIGIYRGYLVLYPDGTERSQALLKLAFSGETRHELPAEGLKFPTEELVPRLYFHRNDRFSVMVEALHYDNQEFGYLVLDMNDHINSIHASVRRIISHVFFGAQLVNKN